MAKQGQGGALDPPGAKPLDLKYMKINGFPKAAGLWWVQGKALALAFSIGQSLEGLVSLVIPWWLHDSWELPDVDGREPRPV